MATVVKNASRGDAVAWVWLLLPAAVAVLLLAGDFQPTHGKVLLPRPKRFTFKIDPKAALDELLPVTPKTAGARAPRFPDDLARVPEVSFQEPFARDLPSEQALER